MPSSTCEKYQYLTFAEIRYRPPTDQKTIKMSQKIYFSSVPPNAATCWYSPIGHTKLETEAKQEYV